MKEMHGTKTKSEGQLVRVTLQQRERAVAEQ